MSDRMIWLNDLPLYLLSLKTIVNGILLSALNRKII